MGCNKCGGYRFNPGDEYLRKLERLATCGDKDAARKLVHERHRRMLCDADSINGNENIPPCWKCVRAYRKSHPLNKEIAEHESARAWGDYLDNYAKSSEFVDEDDQIEFCRNPDDPRIALYRKMAEITRKRCGECYHPHSCCDPMYCEIAMKFAKEHWNIELPITSHPVLPLMGECGCTAPPHLRPICSVHICEKHLYKDPKFAEEYFDLRDAINELEGESL